MIFFYLVFFSCSRSEIRLGVNAGAVANDGASFAEGFNVAATLQYGITSQLELGILVGINGAAALFKAGLMPQASPLQLSFLGGIHLPGDTSPELEGGLLTSYALGRSFTVYSGLVARYGPPMRGNSSFYGGYIPLGLLYIFPGNFLSGMVEAEYQVRDIESFVDIPE